MPTWAVILVAVPVSSALLFVVMLWVTSRRSAAGIVTSRFGRVLRVTLGGVRLFFRHLVRFFRRLFASKAKRAALDEAFQKRTAKRVLDSMGNMKGVLMKLGQIVSFMDETLPEEYQVQLRKLQSNAPPMDYDAVAHVIRSELGDDPQMLFQRFDREPLAAASIGQVHRAQLFDGSEVVVKVQYPGVDAAIRADLDNYGMLVGMVTTFTPNVDAKPIVDEVRERIVEELDYTVEAQNQQTMRQMFADHPRVVIPRVYPQRSSKRVLTSEYYEGQTFYQFVEDASDADKRAAVLTLREYVFDSMWFHHVFNGDPHPGNYIFLPDQRICFIDYGCVKRFDPQFMADFAVLNRAYLVGDRDGYFEKACEMHFIKPGYEGRVDRDWLWEYARWFYLPLLEDAEFTFTPDYCKQALSQLFGENMKRLNMPPEYVVLNRITFGLNSILSRLGACENWRRLSKPYYFPDDVDPITGV